jgi:gas vesicle protein
MNRNRLILLGAVIGAATGVAAALLIDRRASEESRTTAITSGEGLKLGILLFGLLRAIATLGEDR